MRNKIASILSLSLALLMYASMASAQTKPSTDKRYTPKPYTPGNIQLYKTIARIDSIYFGAYNTGNEKIIDSLTSEDLEFYHDRAGLSTSKADNLASLRKNIYGKVTRTLTLGSLEVYEIPGYGAVEFGYHSFRNIAEPGESQPSKFVAIWQKKGEQWQLTRVISLH
ncbi:nuclear transport factor 2 family protein [Mucilaginibacter yixingensis]|nr:nuclear transport factor 2 family protein [Mucilaginibacter yixingensis]